MSQRVTAAALGAWVLKCNPKLTPVDTLTDTHTWCVQNNYRSALIAAHQPVLFWITGPTGAAPQPGIWAIGHTTGPAHHAPTGKLVMPLALTFLPAPIPRDLIATQLPTLEVIRQPHMSNPSFATPTEYATLQQLAAP